MNVFALPAGWLLGIVAVFLAGFGADPYLEHVRGIAPPHPYPTSTVLWITFFITIQSVLLGAILRPHTYRRSWVRAIIALAVSFGFLAFAILGGMHAPPPHAAYLLWLLAVIVVIAGLLVSSIVGRSSVVSR